MFRVWVSSQTPGSSTSVPVEGGARAGARAPAPSGRETLEISGKPVDKAAVDGEKYVFMIFFVAGICGVGHSMT